MAPNSYVVTVTSLLLVLPLVSSALEHALAEKKKKPSHYLSKWFVFWPVGMRLGLAGIQQVRKPEFVRRSPLKSAHAVQRLTRPGGADAC